MYLDGTDAREAWNETMKAQIGTILTVLFLAIPVNAHEKPTFRRPLFEGNLRAALTKHGLVKSIKIETIEHGSADGTQITVEGEFPAKDRDESFEDEDDDSPAEDRTESVQDQVWRVWLDFFMDHRENSFPVKTWVRSQDPGAGVPPGSIFYCEVWSALAHLRRWKDIRIAPSSLYVQRDETTRVITRFDMFLAQVPPDYQRWATQAVVPHADILTRCRAHAEAAQQEHHCTMIVHYYNDAGVELVLFNHLADHELRWVCGQWSWDAVTGEEMRDAVSLPPCRERTAPR